MHNLVYIIKLFPLKKFGSFAHSAVLVILGIINVHCKALFIYTQLQKFLDTSESPIFPEIFSHIQINSISLEAGSSF